MSAVEEGCTRTQAPQCILQEELANSIWQFVWQKQQPSTQEDELKKGKDLLGEKIYFYRAVK